MVSYLPERTYLNPSKKVSDIIAFFKDFYADFSPERANTMLEKFGVDPQAKIKSLSKGMREKVQIVLVMSRDAKLYLLDEPMGGVDPAARDYILRTIIENYDFSGKKIVLFATSGGSGFGNTVSELQPSVPGADIVEGKLLNRADKQTIDKFVETL